MLKGVWPKGLARYLAHHPSDVAPVLSSAWVMRRSQWWRIKPYLPIPDPAYWEFRVSTANGSLGSDVSPEAVVAAARWSRLERRRR
jgi:putative NIF3 family GTP cyclohydrolase 1 type 2